MPDNPEEHVAFEFHGLVSDLQRGDVERFEEKHKLEAMQRALLRRASGTGLSAGELLKKMEGDPESANRRVQEELDRLERDAKAAADKQKAAREPLPQGHFPPPPDSE